MSTPALPPPPKNTHWAKGPHDGGGLHKWLGLIPPALSSLEARSGTSVAGNVATIEDLPTGPNHGQSWVVRDRPGHNVPHPALYTWSETTGAWSDPVSVVGSATAAAIADALDNPTVVEALDAAASEKMTDPTSLLWDAVVSVINARTSTFNVRHFGATGDGSTDDTDAINNAIAAAAAAVTPGAPAVPSRVIVPSGTYMIRAHDPESTFPAAFLGDSGGVAVLSNVHLDLAPDATLKAIPNDQTRYVIARVYDQENVLITGGRIIGDRYQHSGGGEWGYGIAITGGKHVTVKDTYIADCQGDGIDIQRLNAPAGTPPTDRINAEDVRILNVTSVNNWRQGMSIEGVVGCRVIGGEYSYTNGAPPGAGIDIEPANLGPDLRDIKIIDVTFRQNQGSGVLATMFMNISEVEVIGCTFDGNLGGNNEYQLRYYSHGDDIKVRGCTVKNTPPGVGGIGMTGGTNVVVEDCDSDAPIAYGRRPTQAAGDVIIRRCKVAAANTPAGALRTLIAVGDTTDAVVEDNELEVTDPAQTDIRGVWLQTGAIEKATVRDNRFRGVYHAVATTTIGPKVLFVEGNTVEWSHSYGFLLKATDFCSFRGNTINNALLGHTGSFVSAADFADSGIVVAGGNIISAVTYPGLPAAMAGKVSAITRGIHARASVAEFVDAGGNVSAGGSWPPVLDQTT